MARYSPQGGVRSYLSGLPCSNSQRHGFGTWPAIQGAVRWDYQQACDGREQVGSVTCMLDACVAEPYGSIHDREPQKKEERHALCKATG